MEFIHSISDFFFLMIDFILHIDQHLNELVLQYGVFVCAILFIIIFCETGLVVTPFLPGDSLLFVAGAITAISSHHINVHFLVVLLIIAAFLGDTVNYSIGKYFGKKLFSKPDSRFFKQEYIDKTNDFYEKHGGKTIILARYMPIIRTFAPFVAGMGKMTYHTFMIYNMIGAITWVALFIYLGHFFGDLPVVKSNLSLLIILIIFISVLPAIIGIIRSRLARNQQIDEEQ